MRKMLPYILALFALWLTGCQSVSNPNFLPALPTPAEPTVTPTYSRLTRTDLCRFVDQGGFKLGETTEKIGIKWLKSMGYEVIPNEKVQGAYSIRQNDQSFYVLFHDNVLLGGENLQVQTDWTFGDVVANLGPPDQVYGKPMWIFGCEGNKCAYNISLLYLKKGIMVDSSGTELNPIWLENDVAGVTIYPEMKVESVLCFMPQMLDSYLTHAYSGPAKIKKEHLYGWGGFGMVVPLQP